MLFASRKKAGAPPPHPLFSQPFMRTVKTYHGFVYRRGGLLRAGVIIAQILWPVSIWNVLLAHFHCSRACMVPVQREGLASFFGKSKRHGGFVIVCLRPHD